MKKSIIGHKSLDSKYAGFDFSSLTVLDCHHLFYWSEQHLAALHEFSYRLEKSREKLQQVKYTL